MELTFKDKDFLEIEGFRFQLEKIEGWVFSDRDIPEVGKVGNTCVIYKGIEVDIEDNDKKLCSFLDEYFRVKRPLEMIQQRLESLAVKDQMGIAPEVKIQQEEDPTIAYCSQKIAEIKEKRRKEAEEERIRKIEEEKAAEAATKKQREEEEKALRKWSFPKLFKGNNL